MVQLLMFQILHWGSLMLNFMRSCGAAFTHYDPQIWNLLPITFIFIQTRHFCTNKLTNEEFYHKSQQYLQHTMIRQAPNHSIFFVWLTYLFLSWLLNILGLSM